jgi:hypothetical protein
VKSSMRLDHLSHLESRQINLIVRDSEIRTDHLATIVKVELACSDIASYNSASNVVFLPMVLAFLQPA